MTGAPPARAIRRLSLDAPSEAAATDTALAVANVLNGASRLTVVFDNAPQDKQIAHRLGRVPRGWIVSGARNGPQQVYEIAKDAAYLTLRNIGVATSEIDLVIF